MSRLTGNDVLELFEAYQTIYSPQEITEEQVWEEVENWVNSLLEEGYDLSDYTWEEMYESYLRESSHLKEFFGPGMEKAKKGTEANKKHKQEQEKERANRATNQRAQLGVVKTNKGYIAKPGATSYDPQKGAEAIRLANRLNKETGLGKDKKTTASEPKKGSTNDQGKFYTGKKYGYQSWDTATAKRLLPSEVLGSEKPNKKPGAALEKPALKPSGGSPARSAATTSAGKPTGGSTTPARASSPATASTADKIKGGMDVYNKQKAAGDLKGASETGKSVAALANPQKPKTPNPLMQKTFGYQTGNSPKDQQTRADKIVQSGAVKALAPTTAAKPSTSSTPSLQQSIRNRRLNMNMNLDLFDIVKGHLLGEGYADTEEAALVIMINMSEEWRQSIVEAEVLAQKGGVAGSVKVKPALNIPGTSIGVGPNRPVPGTFTTTTPEQRQKISQGDTTIDRGIYKQSRVGAGPTANERQRYNTQLTLSRTPGKLMSQ